jgi:hypothetical protein
MVDPRRLRLHREDGPALVLGASRQDYFWHGTRVPEAAVLRPESLTVAQVLEEPDIEARRVLVERYGIPRLLNDAAAERLAVDDWGTLWRLPLAGDEPIVMVEVLNSTPEPDGTFQDYWLRVPPRMTSPREAVLWTHGLPADAHPIVLS